MAELLPIRVRINDTPYERSVEARKLLVDFIRDDIGLTGTHIGCEHGVCGACTVLLTASRASLVCCSRCRLTGPRLSRLEGLRSEGSLHPLQEAFSTAHGLQCGFCTPGMLMSAVYLLKGNSEPSETDIRLAISEDLPLYRLRQHCQSRAAGGTSIKAARG